MIDVATIDNHTSVEMIVSWVKQENIEVLNVAGPRLSSAPMVAAKAKGLLLLALDNLKKHSSQMP